MYHVDCCPKLTLSPNEEFHERGNWRRMIYGRLALIGSTVGYGSSIYFPYSIMKYKAVYLIPFFIIFILIGIPLFAIELIIGQYLNKGPIKAFANLAPILAGLGWGMVISSAMTLLYYNLYLTQSILLFLRYVYHHMGYISEQEVAEDICNYVQGKVPKGEKFYEENSMFFFMSWLVVAFCIVKGFHYSTKLIVVLNVIPYFLLVVLLIMKILNESDISNIYSAFNFTWENLLDTQMWTDCIIHVIFTLGIAFGMSCTLASYNKTGNKVMVDVILIPTVDCITSLLCTFLIYEHLHTDDVESLLMILCTFSTKMFNEPENGFIYLIFYLLGLSCQIAMTETVIIGIMDQYQFLRNCHSRVVFATCTVLSVIGLFLLFNLHIYRFAKDLNFHTLMIFGLYFAFSAPLFSRNFEKIKTDLRLQICWLYELYLKTCWNYACPIILSISTILHYGFNSESLPTEMRVSLAVFVLLPFGFSLVKCKSVELRNWLQPTDEFESDEHLRRRAKVSTTVLASMSTSL